MVLGYWDKNTNRPVVTRPEMIVVKLEEQNAMEKLLELMALCKCSLSIEVNEHRSFYESVSEHLTNGNRGLDVPDPEIYNRMVDTDTVITIQVYPNTPIGCYVVRHYDLEMALDDMIRILRKGE